MVGWWGGGLFDYSVSPGPFFWEFDTEFWAPEFRPGPWPWTGHWTLTRTLTWTWDPDLELDNTLMQKKQRLVMKKLFMEQWVTCGVNNGTWWLHPKSNNNDPSPVNDIEWFQLNISLKKFENFWEKNLEIKEKFGKKQFVFFLKKFQKIFRKIFKNI